MKRMRWLLGAAMSTALLVSACNGGEGSAPAPGTAPEGGGEQPAPSGAAQPVEKKKITVSIYDRSSIPEGEGSYEKNRWTEWINANGPEDVEVEFVTIPRWQSRDKLNAMFAAGNAPDLIIEYDASIRNDLVSQRLAMPLDELIEAHSVYYKELIGKYPNLAALSTKEDGKNYMVGRISHLDINHYVLIRQDWLDALNLGMPTTPEELLAVATAFAKEDPDGNGRNDTYGIALSGSSNNIITYAYRSIYPVLDENLEYTTIWEQTRAANELKKMLYEAGAVDRDYLTDTEGKKAEEDFISGRLGIWGGNFSAAKMEAFMKAVPGGRLEVMALPKTEFGHYAPELNSPLAPIALINANAKHPDAVMKYIDFITAPETAHVLQYGFEGEHWKEGANGCPEPIDREKLQKEVEWNRDYMIRSGFLDPCSNAKKSDMNEYEAEHDRLKQAARAMYLNSATPVPYSVDLNTVPTLPPELLLIKQNAEMSMNDIWVKSVITPNYSTEAALRDAQHIWTSSGGEQVDALYREWFSRNKSILVKVTDWYQYKVE